MEMPTSPPASAPSLYLNYRSGNSNDLGNTKKSSGMKNLYTPQEK